MEAVRRWSVRDRYGNLVYLTEERWNHIKRKSGDAMSAPIVKYDEPSDTLYVTFAPGEHATGIELNEHILLRINKAERCAVGLTLFDYSLLAQPTDMGVRSLPLTGLADVSAETRDLVLDILRTAPVHDILLLSAYTASGAEPIPITLLQPAAVPLRAA